MVADLSIDRQILQEIVAKKLTRRVLKRKLVPFPFRCTAPTRSVAHALQPAKGSTRASKDTFRLRGLVRVLFCRCCRAHFEAHPENLSR